MGPPPSDELEVRRIVGAAEAALFGTEVEPIRIGRFELIERLGAGGLGVVYAARDPQLDRVTALKLLRGDVPSVGEELLAEARAMARLSHDNVVTVYEAGVDDGRVYIAMERIEGVTLREWMAEPRGWTETLDVLVQAGRGLAAAHQRDLVHRDFKPENVLVDRDGRAYVTDFGLASGLDENGEWHASAGGTPAYMAPEQKTGAAAGPASDQYAFATTLYEALFGERPSPTAKVSVTTDVPPRVQRAIDRALTDDPDGRWPTVEALLDALVKPPSKPAVRAVFWAVAAIFFVAVITGAVMQIVMFQDYAAAAQSVDAGR